MKIYYPEEQNFISTIRAGEKLPVMRLVVTEDSTDEFFNKKDEPYESATFKKHFKLTTIEEYEGSQTSNPLIKGIEDSIILTLQNINNDEETIHVDVFLQDFFAAFLLSQTLKTPIFTIIPSNDLTSLQTTTMNMDELKIVVMPPDKRTNEHKTIMKTLSKLTKNVDETTSLIITSEEIRQVRSEIFTIITSLMEGKNEGLLKVYKYIEKYDNLLLKNVTKTSLESLTSEEKKLIFMKEILIRLENETHPISLAGMLTQDEESALNYIDNALEFEKIMNLNKIEKMNPTVDDTENKTTLESAAKFLNTGVEETPEPLKTLINNVKLKHLWKYDWANPLEDTIDFNTLTKPGDFIASLMIAIASRLTKMQKIYDTLQLGQAAHPTAILISSLTSVGETFRWAAKETLNLAVLGNPNSLQNFIKITTKPDEPLSGALGMILHGLGHLLLDGKISLQQSEMVLKNQPNIVRFLHDVESAKTAVPAVLTDIVGEAACFIPGLLLPKIGETFVYNETHVEEIIKSFTILAEIAIMGETDAVIGSEEWVEKVNSFTEGFIK